MATLSSGEARRARASKHADRSWTCVCGKTVWGNGGQSSHQRACRQWVAFKLRSGQEAEAEYEREAQQLARYGRSPRPSMQGLRETNRNRTAALEALLARWPEGEKRPKDEPWPSA